MLLLIVSSLNLQAAEFNVSAGDVQALINAIISANTNRDASNTINLAKNSVYELRTPYVRDFVSFSIRHGDLGLPILKDGKTLIINGNGSTIRRAMNAVSFRILSCDIYSDITINDLTIENGLTSGQGGGIFKVTGGRLLLKNVKFINNETTDRGGGLSIGSLNRTTIENSEFKQNKAKIKGGGIYNVLSDLTITETKFIENSGTSTEMEGGGLFVDGARSDEGKISITKCIFANNKANASSGGFQLFLYNSNEAIIDQCEIYGNNVSSGLAGGVYLSGGTIRYSGGVANPVRNYYFKIQNTLIYDNSSTTQGGGLWLGQNAKVDIENTTIANNKSRSSGGITAGNSTLSIKNCTIAGNVASEGTGGIAASGTVSASNTIFFDNTGTSNRHHFSSTGSLSDLGNNLQFKTEVADRYLPTTIRVANPLLLPLADNGGPTRTMALQKGSPAIDAGNNCTPTDQRGQRRVGQCDIGAFEYVPEVSTPTVPTAPNNLTATANSNTQITLNWTDNSNNETGFRIERSTTAGSGFTELTNVEANVTTFTNTNLQAGTTYFYRVRAYNAAGNSAYSNEASATTSQPTPTTPTAPSSLTATANSTTQITLNWTDNATNETGFRIERSTTAGSGFTEIAQVGADLTTFTNTNLQAGTTYFYRVRAYNAAGNSAYSNEASATTLQPTPTTPTAPSSLTATANSTTQITLNWTDNANNETGFKIERSNTAGSGFTEIAQVGANVTTFINNNLQAGTTYFYRVRAYNATGNSAYSNEASATTLQPAPTAPTAPINLKATSPIQGQIVLNWDDNANDETGFKIERSTTSGSGFAEIAQVTANVTTYTDNNLQIGSTFFYRVRAYNAVGNSAYSNEASVVVTAVNQVDISNSLNIYPNPTADRLSFKLDYKKQGNFQMRITDLTGRIIISEIWNKNTDILQKDLELSWLSKGIYFIYVYNEDYKAIKKLVKE
ncbi:fibronectin type III domain-containing protein [Thermoflexibacter ruber]|uniref:fibronectin type III domain-containing protein n=1 Tax=Thermoflexibacter ruber TaxID=1003 RepID=UPI001C8684E3|nr:fibronectin type III domain-containing protein [Thermoflexibacter ruber]